MLPKLAENPANKVLVVPTDIAGIAGLAATLTNLTDGVASNGNGNGNGARPNASGTTYRPTAPALPQPMQNNQ